LIEQHLSSWSAAEGVIQPHVPTQPNAFQLRQIVCLGLKVHDQRVHLILHVVSQRKVLRDS